MKTVKGTKQQSAMPAPDPDMQVKFGLLSLAASVHHGSGASPEELIKMSEALKKYIYG